jgi:putative membrane protein
MMTAWTLAWLHLLGLGIGLGGVWVRARALTGAPDTAALRRAFTADAFWGLAAVLWIGTGVFRAFGGFEKGTAYYLANLFFHAKMGMLGLVLVLEVWPMITLIRWRQAVGKGAPVDTRPARRIATISYVQAALVVLMLLAATAMADGLGAGGA